MRPLPDRVLQRALFPVVTELGRKTFKRALLFYLIFSSVALASKGPWIAEFKRVDPTDPAAATLGQWQAGVVEAYRKGGHTLPQFGPWLEIPSESLHRLFPDLRFMTIHWDEVAVPGSTGKSVSRGGDWFVMLAVNSAKRTTEEFSGYGNYEEFGALLSRHGIVINSPADAALVWNAFCDLHQKDWKDQGIEKIDDRTWHLGVITIDRFHYYYRVDLDSDHRITHGILHADEIKPK